MQLIMESALLEGNILNTIKEKVVKFLKWARNILAKLLRKLKMPKLATKIRMIGSKIKATEAKVNSNDEAKVKEAQADIKDINKDLNEIKQEARQEVKENPNLIRNEEDLAKFFGFDDFDKMMSDKSKTLKFD